MLFKIKENFVNNRKTLEFWISTSVNFCVFTSCDIQFVVSCYASFLSLFSLCWHLLLDEMKIARPLKQLLSSCFKIKKIISFFCFFVLKVCLSKKEPGQFFFQVSPDLNGDQKESISLKLELFYSHWHYEKWLLKLALL